MLPTSGNLAGRVPIKLQARICQDLHSRSFTTICVSLQCLSVQLFAAFPFSLFLIADICHLNDLLLWAIYCGYMLRHAFIIIRSPCHVVLCIRHIHAGFNNVKYPPWYWHFLMIFIFRLFCLRCSLVFVAVHYYSILINILIILSGPVCYILICVSLINSYLHFLSS